MITLLILHIFFAKSENPDILEIFCKSCFLVKDLWSTCHFFWRVVAVLKKLLLFSSERRSAERIDIFHYSCCQGLLWSRGLESRAWLKWFRIQLKARIFLLQWPGFYGIECRQLIWRKKGWLLIISIYKDTWLRQGVQTVWRQPRSRGLSCFRLKQHLLACRSLVGGRWYRIK